MSEISLHVGKEIKQIQLNFGTMIAPVVDAPKAEQRVNRIPDSYKQGLMRLIASKALTSEAKVAIIVDDYTRPTPASMILPGVIEALNEMGLTNLIIVVAGGFHRHMNKEELSRKIGDRIFTQYSNRIIQHDALDARNLVDLGKTSRGIPVFINANIVKADLVIGIGTVEIHPWAGFAGGGKIVCPGVAGKVTINHTHALPFFDQCELGDYKGNSFLDTIYEIADMVGLDYIVNVVLNHDEQVIAVHGGPPFECHRQCIEDFMRFNVRHFPQKTDIVITTADPKNQYWGQATIAAYNAARVVKKGGTRIILAKCHEGFGDSENESNFYFESLRKKWSSPRQFWDCSIADDFSNSRNVITVYRHLQYLEESNLIMVSENLPEDMKSLDTARTIEEALEKAKKRHGANASVLAFDMGSMILSNVDEYHEA